MKPKNLITMKKLKIYAPLCLLPIITFAAEENSPPSKTGFFIGLGASYNSVKIDQHITIESLSTIYNTSGTSVAFGITRESIDPYHDTKSTLAPEAQIGYCRHFSNTNWLWGAKISYKYLGLTFTDQNTHSSTPQLLWSPLLLPADSFTETITISSSQTTVNHQLSLIPFIAYSIKNNYLYLGVGPVLFGTHSKLYQLLSYVDINAAHSTITGNAVNFSNSNWTWGGIGQLGFLYYLNPSWFLDLSYTYAVTAKYTNHHSSRFTTTSTASSIYTNSGILCAYTSQRLTTQAFTISINKAF
jgi:hypothetical protein